MARAEPFDYQRYLTSREWALLKEKVRKRSFGHCERCECAPYQETHHLTYERIGHEELHDLLAVCRECHAFLSAKSDEDPLTKLRSISLSEAPVLQGYHAAMGCPGCFLTSGEWWANLHISGADHIHGNDYPEGAYGYRYGAAIIHMWCEQGHSFDFVFGDHKGAVFPHGYEAIRAIEPFEKRLLQIHWDCPDECAGKKALDAQAQADYDEAVSR